MPGSSSIFGAAFTDEALEARVRAGSHAAEQLLTDTVHSTDPFVAEAAAHLLHAGGKRFRPLLVLLSAEFGDPLHPDVVPSAVVVELTHLASL